METTLMNEVVCKLNSIDSATAAAWVQAIGAILALVVAIIISYLQHRNDLKTEARQAQEKIIRNLAVAISLGGGVLAKNKVLEGWAVSSNPTQHAVNIDFLLAEVKSLTRDLVAISLNEVDNFNSLQAISNFKTLASISLSAIENIANLINTYAAWNQVALVELRRINTEFVDELKKAVDLQKSLTKNFKSSERN
jgi:hypothetical protein